MFKKIVTGFVLGVGLLAAVAAWAASPSVDDVLRAYKAGDYARAEGMMNQVLSEHPNNAYAHFLQAQLQAKQGKLTAARGELEKAQKLNPTLSFAKPAAVQELNAELAGKISQPAPQTQKAVAGSNTAGGQRDNRKLIIIVLLVVAGVWLFLRARGRRAVPGPGSMAYPAGAGPMSPQAGGGMGSGIMGGLASGAALGAGVVAGEALMHKVLGEGAQHTGLFSGDTTPGADGAHHADDADFSPADPQAGWDGGDDFSPNNDQAGWDDDEDIGGGDVGGNSDDWS